MNPRARLAIPVALFIVMLVAVGVILGIMGSRLRLPPGSPATIPSPPPTLPGLGVQSRPSAPCLPGTDQFSSLRACNTQDDCATCSETPTSCVVVGGDTSVVDGVLAQPVTVTLPPVTSQPGPCSGHGVFTGDECECDGEWDGAGNCTSDVCYSGARCEVPEFSVHTPGQFCLPSYLGQCDPFTSDTVLSASSTGSTTWSCRCKQSMAGVYTQRVEGGSCDLQIACGAPVGVTAQVNTGTLDSPVFEPGTVYPNRLTSYMDASTGSEPCVYETSVNPAGDVVRAPGQDPTCTPRMYSNKCTVSTGGGNTQVIRGSGMPGDPEVKRVSPPFLSPVPPGLNRCPDGWSGSGTAGDPCVSPSDPSVTHALFTDSGEWAGPDVTSMAELRAWWGGRSAWWGVTSAAVSDVFCFESLYESGRWATASDPASIFCANEECTVGKGLRKRAWRGAQDGPLENEREEPYWVSGGAYGGQCACDDGDVPGHVSDPDTPSSRWTCTPDSCSTNAYPEGRTNTSSNTCECGEVGEGVSPPFRNGVSYRHPNAPPACVPDPCNPMGVNVNSAEVACVSEEDCGGVCVESQCYIPTGGSCRTDTDCSNQLTGMSQRVGRCVFSDPDDPVGACVTLDMQRARMGSTCDEDAQCSLGACVGEEGAGVCTGGCACGPGWHQEPDGGQSPLGATCVDDCVGKCKNGGTCVHGPGGEATCVCDSHYGGPTCEIRLCAKLYEYCDDTTPCCSHCPCEDLNDGRESCCNRFELESTPGGGPVECMNNVCQERPDPYAQGNRYWTGCYNIIQDTTCRAESWYTATARECGGNGARGEDGACVCNARYAGEECEEMVCAPMFGACDTDANCCNSCVCPAGDAHCCPTFNRTEPVQVCESGVCVADNSPVTAPCTEADGTCSPACYPVSGTWIVRLDPLDTPASWGVAPQFRVTDFTASQTGATVRWDVPGRPGVGEYFPRVEWTPSGTGLDVRVTAGVYTRQGYSPRADSTFHVPDASVSLASVCFHGHRVSGGKSVVWPTGQYLSTTRCGSPFNSGTWEVLDSHADRALFDDSVMGCTQILPSAGGHVFETWEPRDGGAWHVTFGQSSPTDYHFGVYTRQPGGRTISALRHITTDGDPCTVENFMVPAGASDTGMELHSNYCDSDRDCDWEDYGEGETDLSDERMRIFLRRRLGRSYSEPEAPEPEDPCNVPLQYGYWMALDAEGNTLSTGALPLHLSSTNGAVTRWESDSNDFPWWIDYEELGAGLVRISMYIERNQFVQESASATIQTDGCNALAAMNNTGVGTAGSPMLALLDDYCMAAPGAPNTCPGGTTSTGVMYLYRFLGSGSIPDVPPPPEPAPEPEPEPEPTCAGAAYGVNCECMPDMSGYWSFSDAGGNSWSASAYPLGLESVTATPDGPVARWSYLDGYSPLWVETQYLPATSQVKVRAYLDSQLGAIPTVSASATVDVAGCNLMTAMNTDGAPGGLKLKLDQEFCVTSLGCSPPDGTNYADEHIFLQRS